MKIRIMFLAIVFTVVAAVGVYAQDKMKTFTGYGNAIASPFPTKDADNKASAEREARISLRRHIIIWFYQTELQRATTGNKELKSLKDFPYET